MRSDSDLGQMLMAALDVTPGANAVEASARYGGMELRAEEQTRAERRRAVVRELQNRFVDGPVLRVDTALRLQRHEKTTLSIAATAAGIATDKMRLLRGEGTDGARILPSRHHRDWRGYRVLTGRRRAAW